MKRTAVLFTYICLAVLMPGCLTVSQYRLSLNYDTGDARWEYCDLRSKQGADEKDYSAANDWAELKKRVAEQKPEADQEVVADIAKEMFEENNMLCARKIQKVKCPKCFPSKAAIMTYLHDKDWRFEMINDEVVLFLPGGRKVVSTNGRMVTTPNNSIIIWPQESGKFEYVITDQNSGGTSLLPNYLDEKNPKK